MKSNMTYEELKTYCEKLENYLTLAMSDFEQVCAEPYGFTKVCNLYRKEFCYELNLNLKKDNVIFESDLQNMFKSETLKNLTGSDVNLKVTTHPYRTGEWSWRYTNEVKQLLGV